MSAAPAADNYAQSQPARILFRPEAEVIQLPHTRSEGQSPPEKNYPKVAQTQTPNSGVSSGAGITVSDIPGDWASVTAVWTGTPEPLADLVATVTAARAADRTREDVAAACWGLLVLTPRALLHLSSWLLQHPVRTAVAVVLVLVYLATR